MVSQFDYDRFFPFPTIRNEQRHAIEFTLDAYLNQNKRFVILEMGTGCGKSATGITVARYLAANPHLELLSAEDASTAGGGAYVLTTQKVLQEQYINDFGPGKKDLLCSIKSSSNFTCQFYKDQNCGESRRVLSKMAKQLAGTDFWKCCQQQCPYKLAKEAFIESPISITNFSYFLAETMYAGKLEPRRLMVIDECVRGDARIWLDDDVEVNMREVFDNHKITHVMSFNEETNVYERRRIIRRIRTPYVAETQWIEIHVEAAGVKTKITVTGNHKVWTKNRGMVRADELNENDVLKYDVLPKRDVTRSFVAHRAGKNSVEQRRKLNVTCDICGRSFTQIGLKQHLVTLIEVRDCLGEGCRNKIEITKSSGDVKKYCSHVCYSSSPVTRANRSMYMLAHNPMYNLNVIAKAVVSWKNNWKFVRSEESKQAQLTRFKNAPLHENRKGPNKLEQQLLELNIPGLQFTGLGTKWVTFKDGRHKNPDFIIDGTRKVIEVGDCFYWHTQDEIENVKRHYEEIGYECLYVTNDDLQIRYDETVTAIRKFACNHDVVVTRLVKLQKPKNFRHDIEHFKYNIEVEGNHNYFVNSVLVSNCHNIESQICSFVEVTFSEKFVKEVLKCKLPVLKGSDETHINIVFDWIKKTYKPSLERHIKRIEKALEGRFNSGMAGFGEYSKQYEMLDKHICKVNRFISSFNVENWVLNVIEPPPGKRAGRRYEFKPIDVSSYGHDMLYRFGGRVLMMSATIVDRDVFCRTVGVDPEQVAFLRIPSPFPIANRSIHFLPTGKMSMDNIQATLPKMAEVVKLLMEQHLEDKGIIHCVNYKVAQYLFEHVKSDRLVIHNSENRDQVLRDHVTGPRPTVLLSPSMMEGVDLADDASRFQILCKVPFPYLGDRVVRKRKARDPQWYPFQTVKSVIQAMGRSIRNENDYAVSYILDEDWDYFYKRNKVLFPEDFSKSLFMP